MCVCVCVPPRGRMGNSAVSWVRWGGSPHCSSSQNTAPVIWGGGAVHRGRSGRGSMHPARVSPRSPGETEGPLAGRPVDKAVRQESIHSEALDRRAVPFPFRPPYHVRGKGQGLRRRKGNVVCCRAVRFALPATLSKGVSERRKRGTPVPRHRIGRFGRCAALKAPSPIPTRPEEGPTDPGVGLGRGWGLGGAALAAHSSSLDPPPAALRLNRRRCRGEPPPLPAGLSKHSSGEK